VDRPVHEPAPRRVAFVRSAAELAPTLDDAWQDRVAAQAREELNGLYVAMTRAREWLVFSCTEPHRRSAGARSWWQRVEPVAMPWQPAAVAAPAGELEVEVPLPLELRRRPAAAVDTGRADDPGLARLGRAIHRVLEWGGADLPALSLAAAREAGLADAQAADVAAVAARVLASPACARFFDRAAVAWSGNEVPVPWQGARLRIDRLVAFDDADGRRAWWVLDYKLSQDPLAQPELRVQLARYVQAVQALQPGEVVQGAFITGVGELIVL
jgi:ATP-dependent helicase/nuclease subunit A